MNTELQGWLLPSSVTAELEEGSNKEILNQLIQLLQKTGKVTNPEQVMQDITAREQIGSTEISDGILVPHARSTGVSSLCAAAGIVNHKTIYMMVVWPENTAPCLKRLSALIEVLLNAKTETTLLSLKDNAAVFSCLTSHLKYYGISC